MGAHSGWCHVFWPRTSQDKPGTLAHLAASAPVFLFLFLFPFLCRAATPGGLGCGQAQILTSCTSKVGGLRIVRSGTRRGEWRQ